MANDPPAYSLGRPEYRYACCEHCQHGPTDSLHVFPCPAGCEVGSNPPTG